MPSHLIMEIIYGKSKGKRIGTMHLIFQVLFLLISVRCFAKVKDRFAGQHSVAIQMILRLQMK